MADFFKKGHTTIGNWEKGIAEPNIRELALISNFFEISIQNLLFTDLSKESPLPEKLESKNRKNASLNASPSASLIHEKPAEDASLVEAYKQLLEAKEELIAMLKEHNQELVSKLEACEEKARTTSTVFASK